MSHRTDRILSVAQFPPYVSGPNLTGLAQDKTKRTAMEINIMAGKSLQHLRRRIVQHQRSHRETAMVSAFGKQYWELNVVIADAICEITIDLNSESERSSSNKGPN
jgi:hypothetical protein